MRTRDIGIMSGVVACIALFFSLMSVTWCRFVYYDIATVLNPNETREVGFGMWRHQSFVLVAVDTGGGTPDVYKVDTCEGYPDDISMDSYWKVSRAFSIIAPALGALATLAMCLKPEMGKAVALILIVTATCQGLVMMLYKSDLCDADTNPMFLADSRLDAKQDSCDLGRNSIINIISMIFWVLAAIVPFVFGRGGDSDDGAAAAPAAAPAAASPAEEEGEKELESDEGVNGMQGAKDEAVA